MARPAASSRSTSARSTISKLTGRDDGPDRAGARLCQAQGLWRDAASPEPLFTDTLELDMSTIEPSLAGPKRPQDRVLLSEVDDQFNAELDKHLPQGTTIRASPVEGENFDFGNGDVAIAAITSCTNTSNPSVLIAAGLVARKAREKGLTGQAVGEDQPRAGQPGGHRLSATKAACRRTSTRSASTSSATAARPASAIPARCRADQQGDQPTMTWSRSASFPATAISKAAYRPTAAPTISPRPRWWWPMR